MANEKGSVSLLEKAEKCLKYPLCDNCLGRQFGQLLSGHTNDERGKIIRKMVAMNLDKQKGAETHTHQFSDIDMSNFSGFKFHSLETTNDEEMHKASIPSCALCEGLFKKLDALAKKCVNSVKNYEFSSFLMGTKLSFDMAQREEDFWEKVGIEHCEPLKAEINREVGKRVEKLLNDAGSHGVRFDTKQPNVNIIIDFEENRIAIDVNPLFIYGEYQKLIRGIPQTKWPSGKYKTSVEQIIAKPFMAATGGKAHKFHGCLGGNVRILLDECSLPVAKLENSWKNHRALSYNEKKNTIETSEIKDFIKLNMKVLKLKTKETGREIIATNEHPFYTPNGMMPLSDIKENTLVAVNPYIPSDYVEEQERIIVDKKAISKVIETYAPTSYKSKIINELLEKDLLPIKSNNYKLQTLCRILAFLFGDGHVHLTRKRDVSLEFYGNKIDLEEMNKDLKGIGFRSSFYKRKKSITTVKDYYGKDKLIKSKEQTVLVCHSKSLWTLMVALGAPVGDKATKNFCIPEWIKTSGLSIKREFLASLLGCEMDKPRLDKRKYNKKSFNTPRFSMNKIENILDNMIVFMQDIKKMLLEFGVETLNIRNVPYTTRKDGNKSIKVILDIKNNFENLIKFYGRVNFRYCKEKEVNSRYALEYLIMKKYIVDNRKSLYFKALELKKKNLELSQIHKILNSELVSKKDLWLWLNKKINPENIKIPNNFPDFELWLNSASIGLGDGLLWETVDLIEELENDIVYDLTIEKNHNFFANGFFVSNCGREDIDARCLAWRPFVLEMLRPMRRNIDLKNLSKKIDTKKVKIRNVQFSSVNEMRKVKESRAEKTYSCIVMCENVKKQDLKKLSSLSLINQKTPQRVLHRRADLLRRRNVKSLQARYVNSKKFMLTVKTDAGLYVKELVSGDNGRTKPSISELLGQKCTCKDLDVVKIEWKK